MNIVKGIQMEWEERNSPGRYSSSIGYYAKDLGKHTTYVAVIDEQHMRRSEQIKNSLSPCPGSCGNQRRRARLRGDHSLGPLASVAQGSGLPAYPPRLCR